MVRFVNATLLAWAMRKFKPLSGHKIRTSQFLQRLVRDHRSRFVHWRLSKMGAFA
jgi:RNA-directed DNA polymerase